MPSKVEGILETIPSTVKGMLDASAGWGLGLPRGIVCQVVTWSEAHLLEVDAARAQFDRQEPGWIHSVRS